MPLKMNAKIPEHAFKMQRKAARQRGIHFELTFEEWWSIWQQSGHWKNRGRYKGQYVMSRYGDVGPYSVNNVRIATNADNNREGHFETMSDDHRQKIIAGYRTKFPEKKLTASPCNCGCGELTKPGNKFIHGHAGRLRLLAINAGRLGKSRSW